MSMFGKIIGGGLGFVLGGPIGALIGLFIGNSIDQSIEGEANYKRKQISPPRYERHQTTSGDFTVSLLVLTAGMMKADGKVLKSELDYVKRYLLANFGQQKTEELLLMLRNLLNQQIDVKKVCMQIRFYMQHSERLQIIHFLFGIAHSDGEVHETEFRMLRRVSEYLGINPKDFSSIKEMFLPETNSAYKILEIQKSATNDEVKKAYRKMAKKYHPDKVGHLGQEVQKAANDKFQSLQEAYDKICRERRIV